MRYAKVTFYVSAAGLLGIVALFCALWLQLSKEWYPCALCILQRYAYGFASVMFVCMLMARVRQTVWNVFAGLAGLSVLSGMGLALYNVWVQAHPAQTCGMDPWQPILNSLPWVHWWPVMFSAEGLCSDRYPPLFGLSMPMWSVLCFALQGLLLILGYKAGKERWSFN